MLLFVAFSIFTVSSFDDIILLRFPIFLYQYHKNWSIFGGVVDVCILLGALPRVGHCPGNTSTSSCKPHGAVHAPATILQ